MGFVDDIIVRGFEGYRGWSDREAEADFNATGGSGKKTSPSSPASGASTNYADIARTQLELQKQANQPAIETLAGSKAGISSAFDVQQSGLEAYKTPLAQKYDDLLKSLTQQQATTTSREFGRRGIPLSSGQFDTTLQELTAPTTERIGGQKNLALADLQNLISGVGVTKQGQLSSIDQAMATLQAGGASNAITQALQMWQAQQTAQQSAKEQAWKEKVYKETTLPESEYAVKKPYYNPNTADTGMTNPFLFNNTQPAPASSPNFRPISTTYGAFGLA